MNSTLGDPVSEYNEDYSSPSHRREGTAATEMISSLRKEDDEYLETEFLRGPAVVQRRPQTDNTTNIKSLNLISSNVLTSSEGSVSSSVPSHIKERKKKKNMNQEMDDPFLKLLMKDPDMEKRKLDLKERELNIQTQTLATLSSTVQSLVSILGPIVSQFRIPKRKLNDVDINTDSEEEEKNNF
jgi:hypothetical protein